MKLEFIDGDATSPIIDSPTVLVHCTNTLGVMGAGIARVIANKWPHVEAAYKIFCQDPKQVQQGAIQIVKAEENLLICNLFGQSGIGNFADMPAIRYEALREGFMRLKIRLESYKTKTGKDVKIVMPRIGCSLAGGSWTKVETVIIDVFDNTDISITVYDFGAYNP